MARNMQRNSKEAREKRRVKRQQVEQCYKDHVPPQVRHMRQARWFARVNTTPQEVAYQGPHYPCPLCAKDFAASEFLRGHITRNHFPHRVPA